MKKHILLVIVLIFITFLTWYPVLSFWFFQSWEATWLFGNCGFTFTPLCLMQGHALLYFIDYKLFGWNAAGWYGTTLFLHIGVVLLMYFLLLLFTKKIHFSFVVALLFGCSYNYYDVLTWGSFNGLYAFMMAIYLLSGIFYYKFLTDKKRSVIWYVMIIPLFILGISVRESALLLPMFLLILDCYYHAFAFSQADKKRLIKIIIPFIILILAYFVIRKIYGGPSYDYIDETVQYRVTLLAQRKYVEYLYRAVLLVGIFAAPQVIPYQLLNFFRTVLFNLTNQTMISYYFFPISGLTYLLFQMYLIYKNWANKQLRSLLIFSFLWFLIPSLAASLPISFTDEVILRQYNANTPSRWRYFGYFGTVIFWVGLSLNWYNRLTLRNKLKKKVFFYTCISLVVGVVISNIVIVRFIENDAYNSRYKPEKEFMQKFRTEFKTLPKNYIFYTYPASGPLKDYLSEWYHVRQIDYPSLTQERGASWEESHMGMLLNRFNEHSATLSSTFFLSYNGTDGLINKTTQARELIQNQKNSLYTINQATDSSTLSSLDMNHTHQISLTLQPKLHVEIPYTIKVGIQSSQNPSAADTVNMTQDELTSIKSLTADRIDFISNTQVTVCGSVPLGGIPGKSAMHLLPKFLIDGNIGSRSTWIANCRPAWIILDLQNKKEIGAVAFHTLHGPQLPVHYDIQVSLDGKKWKQILERKDNTLNQRIDIFPHAVEARYVRFTSFQTVQGAMLALDELEVYAKDSVTGLKKYGNDFEKMIRDCYTYGGVFLRFSWDTDPNNFASEDTVVNNSMYIPLDISGNEKIYTIDPNEGEFFSNDNQFLNRYITELHFDFTGTASTDEISTVAISPRFPLAGGTN